jgi:hypothetical protein
MKRNKIIVSLCSLVTLCILLMNCKHDIPINCANINFKITTAKTDATLNVANGKISVTATGGSGFLYSLNGSAFTSNGDFTNLAGSAVYKIVGKNNLGCIDSATVTLGSIDPCAGVSIAVTTVKVDATSGLANGSISATAIGATTFTYSLNGGAFQTSPIFSNLPTGLYIVTAKSAAGCVGVSPQVSIGATNPCAGINIVINHTLVNATPCVTPTNSGSITASATGSTGFTYNLNGGAYQASGTFANLAPASYVIGAKDVNGCINTKSITVGLLAAGPNFALVRPLITTRCSGSGCHMNGSAASGYNFDADCSIVNAWDQINKTCVLYTVGWSKMPKAPQAYFTAAEKLIITNWVNAGHKYID